MSIYQQQLPQMTGLNCITDGGLETELIFNRQMDLPEFAAYDLLRSEKGYGILFDYYSIYAELARRYKLGLILETPTWRASSAWAEKIGDSIETLHELNVNAVQLIEHIREEYATEETPIVISGNVGPRGDGYTPENLMTAEQSRQYHAAQISSFATCNVDLVSALTLNYVDEAIGVTLAAQEAGLPVCISFTVETDGNLPTGDTLEEAIISVDQATDNGPIYYMINCAHHHHFEHLISAGGEWLKRVKGIRANASCLSHEELDNSEILDDGDPEAFGRELSTLQHFASHISVLGGCCGTDHRHLEEVCRNLRMNEVR